MEKPLFGWQGYMNSDYIIIRIIEQFIQAIVAIVTARKAGNYEQAFHQIQNASQRYLNTDIYVFLNMTPEQLLEHFRRGPAHLDTEQGIFCADLLYETALICEAQQIEDSSVRLKILCLQLYLNIIPKDKEFQTALYKEKVNEIIKELEAETIPESVKESLLAYQKLLDQGFKQH